MNKPKLVLDLLRGLVQAPRTLGVAERFLAAWNAHDSVAIAAMVGSEACGKQNNAYCKPHGCSACGQPLGPAPVHW